MQHVQSISSYKLGWTMTKYYENDLLYLARGSLILKWCGVWIFLQSFSSSACQHRIRSQQQNNFSPKPNQPYFIYLRDFLSLIIYLTDLNTDVKEKGPLSIENHLVNVVKFKNLMNQLALGVRTGLTASRYQKSSYLQ